NVGQTTRSTPVNGARRGASSRANASDSLTVLYIFQLPAMMGIRMLRFLLSITPDFRLQALPQRTKPLTPIVLTRAWFAEGQVLLCDEYHGTRPAFHRLNCVREGLASGPYRLSHTTEVIGREGCSMRLGDLLLLLYAARDSFSSVDVAWDYTYDDAAMNVILERWMSQQPSGQFASLKATGSEGDAGSMTKITRRVWWRKPACWRDETGTTSRMVTVICDGA